MENVKSTIRNMARENVKGAGDATGLFWIVNEITKEKKIATFAYSK